MAQTNVALETNLPGLKLRGRGKVRDIYEDGARLLIVERLRKLAAALREEKAGAVQRIRRLFERCDRLLEARLARKDCGAGRTRRGVRLEFRARTGVQFVASVENRERLDVFAANKPAILRHVLRRILPVIAHSSPSNCARSLRVARKREFFTVSSVVPRASPMARSFRPW